MRPQFLAILASSALFFFAGPPAAVAQNLRSDLEQLVATPAVPGYEADLAAKIRIRLQKFAPATDSLGDVVVTLGTGSPRRMIVAPMDEPGYVVSGITDEGYLRVQRLPQGQPGPLFDSLYEAQPVLIETVNGKWVDGVVAGRSIHLQPGRLNPVDVSHPDEFYIDIGAASIAEVRRAGVDVLNPLAMDRSLAEMGTAGRVLLAAPSIGDRFGAAALVELLTRLDPQKVKGTLVVAFVAEQWTGARGLQRVVVYEHPDELIYVGRFSSGRAGAERRGVLLAPRRAPGSGVLVAVPELGNQLEGFAEELHQLASANRIPFTADFSGGLVPPSYLAAPALPARTVHLGIGIAWPVTPAEFVDGGDLSALASLLELYAQGSASPAAWAAPTAMPEPSLPERPKFAPTMPRLLKSLVESYGASNQEGRVRQTVAALLPDWAKPETDEAGNLVLKVGTSSADAERKRILVVAHLDEIGFVVRAITPEGKLEVSWLGGGISKLFIGHPALVHTENGMRTGVMELPAGWDQPGFQWPEGRDAKFIVDIGARTPEEVGELGIRIGDTVTIPKKYRSLEGMRANGRSFDDRVGCAALLAATWGLGKPMTGRDVTFIWSTGEELGLKGAAAAAKRLAAEGKTPGYVFAVDTFVSSDSPLEEKRFADALVGRGFVIRAVDNSNVVPTMDVDRLVRLARAAGIPVQYGVTGGGNDGSAFLRYGSVDVAIGWPLRYSHSPAEVIDLRDAEALGRIVAEVAKSW